MFTVFTHWDYPDGAPVFAKVGVASWQTHLPKDVKIVFLNDTNVMAYIPDMPAEFFRMPTRTNKADLIRYAALYHHGGIYLDTDYLAARPLHNLISRIQQLDFVSYESGTEACDRGEFNNGFLAGRQGSEVLKRIWIRQQEALQRVCDLPANMTFVQAEAFAASREPCCPAQKEEACHIPERSVGDQIARPLVQAGMVQAFFHPAPHKSQKMLCLSGQESFAPRHLAYMLQRNSGLDRALAMWHEVAEPEPLDRYMYHLFASSTGLDKLNLSSMFDNTTLRGRLLHWSFDDDVDRVRSQKHELEESMMLIPKAVVPEAAAMAGVRTMTGLPVHAPCTTRDPRSAEEQKLAAAVQDICAAGQSELLEAWIAPGFEENYKKIYDRTNWVEEAFVNYLAAKPDSKYAKEAEELILSVHNFSTRPIVLIDYRGADLPQSWTPKDYPRLIVLQAKPLRPGISFNFNKLRAMILAQVRTGIQVDADQFVYRGVDNLFARTAEEVTQEYPYPILPVHWMARDPSEGNHSYSAYDFFCARCPKRTLRWSHAHPTWTYFALPFIGQLLNDQVTDKRDIMGYRVRVAEDEDSFNVGLWAVGAWKQWCKFDVPATEIFSRFIDDDTKGLRGCCGYEDPKWYPSGVPLVFYTAHGCTNPMESREMMWHLEEEHKRLPSPYYYNGTFYSSPEALRGALTANGSGAPPCII